MNDFLIKNSLSDNVSFLEIKTHKTKLVENSSYRGEDVYSISKDLSGSTAQVLNQRDNFQKEFYALKAKSRKNGNFETNNILRTSSALGVTTSMKQIDSSGT